MMRWAKPMALLALAGCAAEARPPSYNPTYGGAAAGAGDVAWTKVTGLTLANNTNVSNHLSAVSESDGTYTVTYDLTQTGVTANANNTAVWDIGTDSAEDPLGEWAAKTNPENWRLQMRFTVVSAPADLTPDIYWMASPTTNATSGHTGFFYFGDGADTAGKMNIYAWQNWNGTFTASGTTTDATADVVIMEWNPAIAIDTNSQAYVTVTLLNSDAEVWRRTFTNGLAENDMWNETLRVATGFRNVDADTTSCQVTIEYRLIQQFGGESD